jgi:hypothetical protein
MVRRVRIITPSRFLSFESSSLASLICEDSEKEDWMVWFRAKTVYPTDSRVVFKEQAENSRVRDYIKLTRA